MICDFESLLGILPSWMRPEVNSLGRENLQELRLRKGAPAELIYGIQRQWLRQRVTQADMDFCINAATHYSPWTAASTASGYVTAPGGHRIGICGDTVVRDGQAVGIRNISSLCIRVARDFPGIGENASQLSGSVLILGAPGWGKTTLLRDLIRWRSGLETVAVVDERGELFPEGFDRGRQTDVLTGCPKEHGILQVLKTMGPQTIAVDEITGEGDCRAICRAANCGVSLFATAHAGSLEDFCSRQVYSPLLKNKVFGSVLILHRDQTYQVERMTL